MQNFGTLSERDEQLAHDFLVELYTLVLKSPPAYEDSNVLQSEL